MIIPPSPFAISSRATLSHSLLIDLSRLLVFLLSSGRQCSGSTQITSKRRAVPAAPLGHNSQARHFSFHHYALSFQAFVLSSPPLLMASHSTFLAPRHTTLRITRNIGWGVGEFTLSCVILRSRLLRFLVSFHDYCMFNFSCLPLLSFVLIRRVPPASYSRQAFFHCPLYLLSPRLMISSL